MERTFHEILSRPGSLACPSNLADATDFAARGGRVRRLATGHLVFYGPHGRRVLATDPDGNPLHECEWAETEPGRVRLVRARIRLDWGQWVGLKPAGLVNATTLDLSRKPGWQRLTADDLRRLAAQALRVPLEEIRFFYGDDDLVLDGRGQATIRHRKDVFYVLDDGTFERARFMACMGAMHWERIDFLPVVELFQSLLPGTGSAAFELIRGLYDDQNEAAPLPLRYRGIPTYPSEAAYKLFGAFFTPRAPGGGDPFPIFMDPPRSHEVTWLPAADSPRRHFDAERRLCVTIQGPIVQKVTLADDPAGLPFLKPAPNGVAPCARSVTVARGQLVLRDGAHLIEIPVRPSWGAVADTPPPLTPEERGAGGEGWRGLFAGSPPQVTAQQAYGAVLLYPEDDREIEEAASQPFVADFLQDALEQPSELGARAAKADRIVIVRFEAALAACLHLDRPRTHRILYRRPEFAQKQAQALWNRLAQANRLDWASRFSFLPLDGGAPQVSGERPDLLYLWLPFDQYENSTRLAEAVRSMVGSLAPGGLAFVVGPEFLGARLQAQRLRLLRADPVEALPTFRMHRNILPQARLKPGLTLFTVTSR
ncbi:hypothetical protein [Nitrospira sp. Kam-Ns4a]